MFPGFGVKKRQQNLLRLFISPKNANYINKPSRQATCLQYLKSKPNHAIKNQFSNRMAAGSRCVYATITLFVRVISRATLRAYQTLYAIATISDNFSKARCSLLTSVMEFFRSQRFGYERSQYRRKFLFT